MTKINKNLAEQWNQASHKILQTTINSLNEATVRERSCKLSQFSTQALEKEILSRQKCQFGRLTCTEQAEDYIIKPFNYQKNPVCWNCKQDIVGLLKTQRNNHDPKGIIVKNYE